MQRPSVTVKNNSALGSNSQAGISAFNWDVYKNRRTALEHLKHNCTLVDTILETEDGSAHELVHSQVISAFGERLINFISQNGVYVDSHKAQLEQQTASLNTRGRSKLKLIRLPKLNRYTLNILVECAYTGFIRTDLPSGGIWQVLEVADYYEMTEVIKACCAFLVKNLDRSNCVKFYHVGIKHKHTLQLRAWHKIRANFKHILAANVRTSLNYLRETAPSPGDLESEPGLRHLLLLAELEHEETESGGDESNLATIKLEHFEPLLLHDKLNVDYEETLWYAIKLWCNYKPPGQVSQEERSSKVANLLTCLRFPRFRSGPDFSARHIWRDPLILANKQAQHQLAILDRNHRDILAAPTVPVSGAGSSASGGNGSKGGGYARDGFSLPCAKAPRPLKPRVPHSILLAIGGWQQGQPTTLIESYDINCNLWFDCNKRIMSPLAYHGIEYINGLLYICGGTDGSEILNEVFTFDPVRGDCSQRPSMREARCYVSTANLDGHLYAMGGHNGSARMKSVERFNWLEAGTTAAESGRWENVREMNVARSDASACVYESLIYIAGGLNDQVIESSVEFYNQADNTWTFISSMLSPRTSFTLLLYRGHLLAIGGNNGSERLSSVEQYDFRTKLWRPHSSMRNRRSTFSAALLDGSRLIVVGGYNGQTPFNQVEMFDEDTRGWLSLQKIRFDRSGLKVVAVSDLANATDYTYQNCA